MSPARTGGCGAPSPRTDGAAGLRLLSVLEAALGSIGALVSNLSRGWVLSAIPDPETIVVVRNDEEIVPRLDDSPSGGWFYRPQTRSVAFQGEAVPGYEDIIDIYYLPQHSRVDQVGRPLPF